MMGERARCAFAEVIGDGDQTVLLLDHRGGVRAGLYLDSNGRDVSSDIGAALAGVSMDATRAMRHLGLGEWKAIVCECAQANVAFAPADDGDGSLSPRHRQCRMGSSGVFSTWRRAGRCRGGGRSHDGGIRNNRRASRASSGRVRRDAHRTR